MKKIIILTFIVINIAFTLQAQMFNVGVTSGDGIRIGKIGDTGNLLVPVGALSGQYNIDFTGYRDMSIDQIGARISALRFNCYNANNALVQNTGLAFYTNPIGTNTGTTDLTERMRITPQGYIGIGTTTPNAKLESVIGVNAYPATSGAIQTGAALRLRGGDNAILDFGMNSTNTWIQATDQLNLALNYNLSLNPNGGNVGIGTTTPGNKLHVVEAAQSEFYGTDIPLPTANMVLEGTDAGRTVGKGPSLIFKMPANTDGSNSWAQARILASPDNANNNDARGRLYFQVRDQYTPTGGSGTWNWRTGMMISANGKVSIGTTVPDPTLNVLLTVNGTIHTKEVIIDLNPPLADFVFDSNYKLMPLNQVEQYVNMNNHLPEMPSAVEVSKKGMSMGEMQNKLLQKVEELTLYVIEQQKKIEELEQKLK